MASIDDIYANRLSKLKTLIDKGMNPYPVSARRDLPIELAISDFDNLVATGGPRYMVGRILNIRAQGKIIFLDFSDGTGKFQALLKKGEPLPDETFELFETVFDIGDFIEVRGTFFLTKKEEKTLLVDEVRMLAKTLRPLPEKWHGLSDVEERFRKRYLDILSNQEVKDRFILRSRLVTEIRRILDDAGYLEVETPVLQPVYGGASAEPFTTHHNALDVNFYLRISDELYLKRLLAAGFPKVYEIARDFRNEGIDTTHNPEFTMLEFYEAYSDAAHQRAFVENMMKIIVKNLFGTLEIEWDGEKISFHEPFRIVTYYEVLKEHAGLENPESMTDYKELDNIYKQKVRPKLIQPTFIIDYPADYLPLAKKKEGKEGIVDAFQLVIGGTELVKAFSELNDPIDQRARFETQEKIKKEGDKEAQVLDEDFLEAMEYGIPPAGGVGIGIDRLAMLLTGVKNIKEVILFPTLRPKN